MSAILDTASNKPSATMKAIVKKIGEPGGLSLEDVPFPVLTQGHVLIKIKKTAICGTDLHIYNWDAWSQKTITTPQIIGHEFVGVVVETGPGVSNVQVGQLVSGEGHIVCSKCRHCITGNSHLCRQTLGLGVNIDGAFAQYIAFPASNIWICDEGLSLDILAIQDPLGNAVHTALSFGLLGEDVLITGAGPIGLMSVPVVKRAGARNIVVTDINPARLAMAMEMGATAVIDVRSQKIGSVIGALGLAEGFDVGLEMSGSAAGFTDMVDHMANGGKIAMLGIPPADMQVDWNKVIFGSLTLKGIYGRQMYDTWYKMTAMLQSGLAGEIEKIITHRFNYRDYQAGFDVMFSGESGKVILDWETD